jgi:hypothetical protein
VEARSATEVAMSIIHLIIILIVIGVLLWLANTHIPMDANIKKIMNVVVIICVVLWLLNVFGVLNFGYAPVPHLRQ